MLISLFKRTFHIRDGEIRISFFMQLYVLLLITVLLLVKPTINALFLSRLGAEFLPYGYILVALSAIITSLVYKGMVRRFSLKAMTISTLIFFSLCFMVLSILMHFQMISEFSLYVYYISVSIFAVLVTSQFWLIANIVYNAREAKRLFGFIGAGAIAGGILGGYLTTILASAFGNKVVIIVAALLLLCCIPIIMTVWKLRIRKLNRYLITMRQHSDKKTATSSFKLIISSKHLTYLAAIVGVGVVIAKLVDFQFSDFANKAIPDSDELASFFGFWFSTFNVLALIIQLFLTNRLLAWIGVTSNLLILPLGIAIGSLLFLTFPELWVLIIIKGLDGSFKQSINKAGMELSILPIPSHIKNEAKSFIDVVVDSIATGLAGLLLVFIVRGMDLSTSYITVMILFFLFGWLLLIYKLRDAYFDSFRANIQNSLVESDSEDDRKLPRNSLQSASTILKDGTEEEILNLLNRLEDVKLQTFKPFVLALLDHESPKVKAATINQLYSYSKGTAVDKVQAMLTSDDDELVFSAMNYLLNHSNQSDERIFSSYLDHESDYISSAALLCLAKESASNNKLGLKFDLTKRIDAKIRELFYSEEDIRQEEIAELLLTAGYTRNAKYVSFISANFNNKEAFIVDHAIEAAGIMAGDTFVVSLLNFLDSEKHSPAATKALIAFGPAVTKTILKLDATGSIKDKVKVHVPKVIKSFKDKDSLKVLVRLLRSKDFIIRLEAAKALYELRLDSPSLKMSGSVLNKALRKEIVYYTNSLNATASIREDITSMISSDVSSEDDANTDLLIARETLLDVLFEQMDQSVDAIFKILSLKYDPTDIDTAYYGLKSELTDTKVNALEFLDNLLQPSLKSKMLPLLEYHLFNSDVGQDTLLQTNPLSENRVLSMLSKNRGVQMKLAVLNVLQYSKTPANKKIVVQLAKHKNQKVRRFAAKILTTF